MSYSFTHSTTQTFTLTHAKELASKIATDLKRIQRFYGYPSDSQIADYEAEVTQYLKQGYLSEVTYGFKRGDNWIEPTLRYSARDLAGMTSGNDDPGRISPGADITGATFYSYLIPNSAYSALSETERGKFLGQLPIERGSAPLPGISGHLSSDKTYSSGGKALDRSSLKSY